MSEILLPTINTHTLLNKLWSWKTCQYFTQWCKGKTSSACLFRHQLKKIELKTKLFPLQMVFILFRSHVTIGSEIQPSISISVSAPDLTVADVKVWEFARASGSRGDNVAPVVAFWYCAAAGPGGITKRFRGSSWSFSRSPRDDCGPPPPPVPQRPPRLSILDISVCPRHQAIRDFLGRIKPALDQCCSDVCDVGTALNQHCLSVPRDVFWWDLYTCDIHGLIHHL